MTGTIAMIGVVTMLFTLDNGVKAFGEDTGRRKARWAIANFIVCGFCMFYVVSYG